MKTSLFGLFALLLATALAEADPQFTYVTTNGAITITVGVTNLANPVWQALRTNTFTAGLAAFNDARSTNYLAGFYRVRQR